MTQQAKTLFIVLIAIVLIAGFLIITQRNNEKEDSITIGATYPLTSYGATWGENQMRGAQLAVDEINASGGVLGKQLKLVVEDNATEPRQAVSSVQKLIQTNDIDVLLTGWTHLTQAILPLIHENNILTFDTSSGARNIASESEYVFRTWPSDVFSIQALVGAAQEEGTDRVAVVRTIGAWEDDLHDAFVEEAQSSGLEVVEDLSFPLDEKDFSTTITKLQVAEPQMVFIALQTNALGSFLQQAHRLGLDVTYLYPVNLDSEENKEFVGDPSLFEGIIYPVHKEATLSFRDAYQKKFGAEAGVASDTAYDAVYIAAQAIERAGSVDPDVVIDHVRSYTGASGTIEFDQHGERISADVVLMTYRNGEFVPYDPTH